MRSYLVFAAWLVLPALLPAQGGGLEPSDILKPLKDSWPTYNGDYTGRRYSALTQIDQSTVKNLTLAWFSKVTAGPGGGGGRGGRVIVGGEGSGDFPPGTASFKASALEVDGTLYISTPDNAWAIDARDGRELWHYFWKTQGQHAHRKSRARHVEQLSVHGDAGRLSGVAGCEDR